MALRRQELWHMNSRAQWMGLLALVPLDPAVSSRRRSCLRRAIGLLRHPCNLENHLMSPLFRLDPRSDQVVR